MEHPERLTLYRLPGPRHRNPWPRRLAGIIVAVGVALMLYACTGEAAPPGPNFNRPKWGPMAPPYTNHDRLTGGISWCIKGAPAHALPDRCSRRPHR